MVFYVMKTRCNTANGRSKQDLSPRIKNHARTAYHVPLLLQISYYTINRLSLLLSFHTTTSLSPFSRDYQLRKAVCCSIYSSSSCREVCARRLQEHKRQMPLTPPTGSRPSEKPSLRCSTTAGRRGRYSGVDTKQSKDSAKTENHDALLSPPPRPGWFTGNSFQLLLSQCTFGFRSERAADVMVSSSSQGSVFRHGSTTCAGAVGLSGLFLPYQKLPEIESPLRIGALELRPELSHLLRRT